MNYNNTNDDVVKKNTSKNYKTAKNTKQQKQRISEINRTTKETSVIIKLNIDGTGNTVINTGIFFLDHLITSLGKHAMIDINIQAKSHDGIIHHLIEDVGISLAKAIDIALGDRVGIRRYGFATIPMDECLSTTSIDLIKRQFHRINFSLTRNEIEGISREDMEHFINSFLQNLNACTHVKLEYGENDHHKIESMMKSFAIAFKMASSTDYQDNNIPSTKGMM